jgi:hypothetical protein
MKKSDSIVALSKALAAFQGEMPAVQMNAVNPFLKNKYADLGAIIETAKPIMHKHGLSVSQLATSNDGTIGVETMLMHESGEWIASSMELPIEQERGKSTAQVAGSIITYLRRYSLSAVLGIYADEDVDGNGKERDTKSTKAENKPAKQAEKPAAPDAPTMTLEEAKAIKNSEGIAYGSLENEKLANMGNAIARAQLSERVTPEQAKTYATKAEAIKLILASRQ